MKDYKKIIEGVIWETLKEAIIVFLALFTQNLILMGYYVVTIFLLGNTPPGQLLPADMYLNGLLRISFNLTLGYVIGGYGTSLFVYRMFIAPYIVKAGILAGKELASRQLFVLKGFLLTAIISIVASTHMILSVYETDLGDLYIYYHFAKHSILSALVASLIIFIIFFLFIKRKEKGAPSIAREYSVFAPIFLLALCLGTLLPSYERAFADLSLIQNKRMFEYGPGISWVTRVTSSHDEGSYDAYLDAYKMDEEANRAQTLLAHQMVSLARNDTERAEAYRWLAYLSENSGSYTSQQLYQQVAYFLDPQSPSILLYKAKLELYRGRFDKAVDRSQDCIDNGELVPDATACYETKLLGYWFGGDEVMAQETVNEMYKRYREWPSAIIWNNFAPAFTRVYHLTISEGAEKAKQIEIFCKVGSKEACQLAYARNYWGLWQFKLANSWYDSVLGSNPNSVQATTDKLQLEKEMKLLNSLSPAKPCSNCEPFYNTVLDQLNYQIRSND
ncbi:MAG TPA: hypothetical protein VJJ22_01540 [Candidatus Paceibacterota bacterium]